MTTIRTLLYSALVARCFFFESCTCFTPAKVLTGSHPTRVWTNSVRPRPGRGIRVASSKATPISRTSTERGSTTSSEEDIASMRAGAIKKELESYGIPTSSFVEKSELVAALKKARAEGLKPKEASSTSKASSSSKSSSSSSSSKSDSKEKPPTDSRPREVRLAEEMTKCQALKAGELKKELEDRGISTKSFFEKTDFVKALAEARVDGVDKKEEEGYAEYTNVEVLTDASSGPRQRNDQQRQGQQPSSRGSSPFGGGASPFGGGASPFGGGASPFGGGASPFSAGGPSMADAMGGMGGMGGIADMLKNMGMGGAAAGGGSPFGGGDPFGGMGGMGAGIGKAQEMMKNPKVMALMQKAQGNPKVMAAMQECMSNPAAFTKYQNDPEVSELVNELKKYM